MIAPIARRALSRLAASAACMLALGLGPASGATIDEAPETLVIETDDGARHEFRIHLAVNDRDRARGLMFVRRMPRDVGMLFIYPQPREIGMWMKNTYIPLDMIFIGPDGRILNIAANTVPHSLATVSSSRPAIGVLEINGGLSASLGLAPGQPVRHRLLPSGATGSASGKD